MIKLLIILFLCLTPEQKAWENIQLPNDSVLAWSRHKTGYNQDDKFLSVATIPGSGGEDEVWVIVERTIDGVKQVNVEQFQPRDFGDQNNAWFVDCGLVGWSDGGGGLINIIEPTDDVTVGEYPTLQELTDDEIPDTPAEPEDTALVGATNVNDYAGLQAMTGSGHYNITGDIDLEGETWIPIDDFSGVIEGNGFTISNLTHTAEASAFDTGMFNNLLSGAEIRNLTLKDFAITGDFGTGALAGNGVGDIVIKDVNVTGCTIEGYCYLGALVGFLEEITSGGIYDCDAIDCTISGTDWSGGLCGYIEIDNDATDDFNIVNCSVADGTLTVLDGTYCGGLVGSGEGTIHTTPDRYITFHTCSSSMNIIVGDTDEAQSLGGFIGLADWCDFISCSATGNIDYIGSDSGGIPYGIGGFVGFETGVGTYINCYSTGDITMDAENFSLMQLIGGFVGKCDQTATQIFTRCYSTGDITMTNVGSMSWHGVGGFMGGYLGTGGTIRRCWSEGDISLDDEGVPGVTYKGGLGSFIGMIWHSDTGAGTIENCYAWGSITIETLNENDDDLGVSGFLGSIAKLGTYTLTNCYDAQTDTATGSGYTSQIPTGDYSKGLVGWLTTSVTVTDTAIFWDTETSGIDEDDYAVGHITTWMQTQANYEAAGWDFDTIWVLDEVTTPGEPGDSEPNTWSGMDHAIGMEVCVYADGRPIGVYTVDANGVLDLGAEYETVIAGINYYSTYESFPLVTETNFGLSTGQQARIMDITIDFYESLGCHVGVDRTNSTDWIFSKDDFATRIDLVTEYKKGSFLWGTTREPIVYLWEWEPVPLTVRAIYPKMGVTSD